jgi:hypothetical protein
MSESRTLRDRQSAASADLDRSAGGMPHGAAALIAQTTTVATYPTTAGLMYGLIAQDIDGDEVEGAACTYTATSANVLYAVNLGTAIPPNGTNVIVSAVGGRWAFRYD